MNIVREIIFLKTPQEIARIYSKEIEYSQENMEIIF